MVKSEDTVDKPMNPAAEAEQMQSICSSRSNELKISGRLKEAIMSKLAAAASNPSKPVGPDLIQLRLGRFFPSFRTPFHPPYASMIEQAILKLNKEGGSSEEAISRFIEKEYEGLPWAHASFLSHHLKKLCRKGQILCVNNERYMLPVDVADFGHKEEETIHGSNIANRDGKEDQTFGRANGKETEAIAGWSGVNGDHTEESQDQFEIERQSVEVNGKSKACAQRILDFEEEEEGKQEAVEEVREESQNLCGQIEAAEEINEVKAKLAEVSQEQRGKKRKQPEITEQQIKILKDDIPQPVMGEEKKCFKEQQQQMKSASKGMKSIVQMIDKQEQPQQGKMNNEEGKPQQIDIRTKMLGFPCDAQDGENLKWKRTGTRKPQLTPLWEFSMNLLKERKKEALQHEGKGQREPHYIEKDLIIVCALPAQPQPQSRTSIYPKAHKLQTDFISTSLESSELGQILGQQVKLSSSQRPKELQVTTYDSFTQSQSVQKPSRIYKREIPNSQPKVKSSFGTCKNLDELVEKREQEFQRSEMLLKCKMKTKNAIFDGVKAAVSQPIEVKDSMNAPLILEQHGRERQNKLIKVYVRRKVRKCQPKG